MKANEKARYTRVLPEVIKNPEQACFFCQGLGAMDDYTPNPSASQEDLDSFTDPWQVVKACNACWRKIYTSNIVSINKYNRPRGMMSLENKIDLVAPKTPGTPLFARGAKNAFCLFEAVGMITPTDAGTMGDSILIGVYAYTYAELLLLQGPLALAYQKRPAEHIEACLAMCIRFLDLAKEPIYREMLGLSTTPPVSEPDPVSESETPNLGGW